MTFVDPEGVVVRHRRGVLAVDGDGRGGSVGFAIAIGDGVAERDGIGLACRQVVEPAVLIEGDVEQPGWADEHVAGAAARRGDLETRARQRVDGVAAGLDDGKDV